MANKFEQARERLKGRVSAPVGYMSYSAAAERITGNAVNRAWIRQLVHRGLIDAVALVDDAGFLMASAVSSDSVERYLSRRAG